MNLSELRARLAQLAELRAAAQQRVDDIYQASASESRAQTDDERAVITAARAEAASIDAEVEDLRGVEQRLQQAQDAADDQAPAGVAADEQRQADAAESRTRATVRVGREPRTYERWDTRTSYLRDAAAASGRFDMTGAREARERLERHAAEARVELPRLEARLAAARGGYQHEIRAEGERGPTEIRYQGDRERRDLDRLDTSGGEFVPPLWLIEDYIGLSRASRVMADLCNGMPLPPGTDSINIPKVSTGTATAIQTADNAAVAETDAVTASVQANVKTIAGQQDVALQLLEQSPISFDQVIFADLIEDHAVRTDVQVISGSNASGQVRGIENIASVDVTAYTDATPTVPELYPKIADSANVIATTRYRPPEAIVMHPRRWYWMLSAVDSSNRPLVVLEAQGPQNALAGVTMAPSAEGRVGVTPFGAVYTDANIPTNLGAGTNEDEIIVTRPSELYLWEGPIRTRVLEEVGSGNLTVRFQVYNYLAFMPDRRAENTSLVQGTGLVAPTF